MANEENIKSADALGNASKYTHTVIRNTKLHEFFVQQLQDIYWAEKKLLKVLPKLTKASTSATLKQAFNDHLDQTMTHVTRLESIFNMLGEDANALKCPAMVGIAEEAEDIIDETDRGSAQRDVGLIFAAQKVEHYEIATYGGLAQLARTMGHAEAANLLEQTLAEEKVADALLTRIAETEANVKAVEEKQDD
jgi:Uncharacterized protein conserved in bacteria